MSLIGNSIEPKQISPENVPAPNVAPNAIANLKESSVKPLFAGDETANTNTKPDQSSKLVNTGIQDINDKENTNKNLQETGRNDDPNNQET